MTPQTSLRAAGRRRSLSPLTHTPLTVAVAQSQSRRADSRHRGRFAGRRRRLHCSRASTRFACASSALTSCRRPDTSGTSPRSERCCAPPRLVRLLARRWRCSSLPVSLAARQTVLCRTRCRRVRSNGSRELRSMLARRLPTSAAPQDLRALNAVRDCDVGLPLTHAQFAALSPRALVRRAVNASGARSASPCAGRSIGRAESAPARFPHRSALSVAARRRAHSLGGAQGRRRRRDFLSTAQKIFVLQAVHDDESDEQLGAQVRRVAPTRRRL